MWLCLSHGAAQLGFPGEAVGGGWEGRMLCFKISLKVRTPVPTLVLPLIHCWGHQGSSRGESPPSELLDRVGEDG